MQKPNPCVSCGACCLHLRVTFYWGEADDVTPGGVPAELTVRSTRPHCLMMRKKKGEHRCVALEGKPGHEVGCSIYSRRPAPCREFPASYENGEPNPACDRARARLGLPPLRPEDWGDSGGQTPPMAPAA